jgi:phosphoglycolate phosphatase-like HAD superfamily hydrolase
LKPICRATKANAEPCKAPAVGQHGLCWGHAPENAAERRRVASRGGKGKKARRTNELWDEIKRVIHKVEAEEISPQVGNTMLRGYSSLLGLARYQLEESELEIHQRRLEMDEQERGELLAEIEEMRELLQARKDKPWAG